MFNTCLLYVANMPSRKSVPDFREYTQIFETFKMFYFLNCHTHQGDTSWAPTESGRSAGWAADTPGC